MYMYKHTHTHTHTHTQHTHTHTHTHTHITGYVTSRMHQHAGVGIVEFAHPEDVRYEDLSY